MTKLMARKLNKSSQLSYQSSPQVKADLGTLKIRLGLKRDYLGSKLAEGHVVNAIVFWLTRLDPEVGDRVASHALDMLEDYVMDRSVRSATVAIPESVFEVSNLGRVAEVEVEILGNVSVPPPTSRIATICPLWTWMDHPGVDASLDDSRCALVPTTMSASLSSWLIRSLNLARSSPCSPAGRFGRLFAWIVTIIK